MKHAERRQITREALIASARAEIGEAGISGASARRIAERAGYTQGAFYSNFETLNALLEAVLDLEMRQRLGHLDFMLSEDGSLQQTMDRLGAWLRYMQDDTASTLVMLEFQVHALRDPEFAQAYNRQRATQHDLVARGIQSLATRHGLEMKLPPSVLALGLSALWSGFALQGHMPDDLDADRLINAFIRALL